MKKKLSTILGVGLTFVLLASLMAFAPAVSAGTLSWSSYTIPSETDEVIEDCDVADLAVAGDGETIYAGGGGLILYSSSDRGETWSTITTDNDTDLVAVAPDDDQVAVYADTANLSVFVTKNAGTTWYSLGKVKDTDNATAPVAATFTDIAISAASSGVHYVAVSGTDTANFANVWYYNVGATTTKWVETKLKTGFYAIQAGAVASAVAFSPNFPTDEVMVAVTEIDDGAGGEADNISFEIYSFDAGAWNETGAGFSSYPVTIATDDGITGLTSASISLSPTYLGSDEAERIAFVGLDVTGDDEAEDEEGIYRLSDVTVKQIKEDVDINSVAFDGTNLVAGRYDNNYVYYCSDPLATTPTVSTATSRKRPGIDTADVNEMTIVAWAGSDVVAGTSGDESAFAVSRNNGMTFTDISLVDTSLRYLSDVAVSSDGSEVYLATSNQTTTRGSLWREEAGSWERVLAIGDAAGFIVRFAPEDPDVVYVADQGAKTIYFSKDGGETRWQLRTCAVEVQDLAVESEEVAYALDADDGKVSKSTNTGFTWGTPKSTAISPANMIVSLGEDKLMVGSTDGRVSYSTDGNSSWTKIAKSITAGDVQVIASGLADEDYIYAATSATGDYIYRWQLAVSTAWSEITADDEIPANSSVYGLALHDGILYAVSANGTDSISFRTLDPTGYPTVYWSEMTSTADLQTTPQAVMVSAGSAKLWAIDTDAAVSEETGDSATVVNGDLYSYTDTLADVAPTLVGPKEGLVDKVNPVSGYAMDITFSWEQPSDKVTEYELKLYDEEAHWLKTIAVASSEAAVSQAVGKDITDASFSFMPGATYTWKVRVSSDGPVYSLYSETRTLKIETVEAAIPEVTVTVPPTPAPEVTVTPAPAPEITVLPPEVTVEMPEAQPAVPFWALLAIIIIGAVLLIALIVLIVRTRRVA